jgi:signal transduction histidine kinase
MWKVLPKAFRKLLPRFFLRIDLRIPLSIFTIVVLGGIWLEAYLELKTSRVNILSDARRDAQSLSRLFLEHAYRTIEGADQAAIYLRYRYTSRGTSLNLAKEIENGLVARNVYNLFSVIDEKGDVILSSQPFSPMNLADRAHIKVHMNGNEDTLFISKPVLGRVSQRWSLQLTRRINRADGRFGGVVVVSMDPQYFTRLYHQIDVGQYGAISLVGTDGIARVRRIGDSDAMGESVADGKVFQAMSQQPQGMIEAVSAIDGRTRLYAYQKLPQYPLYAAVGIDIEERLSQYYAERNRTLTLVTLISVGAITFNAAMLWLASLLLRSRKEALAASQAKSRFLSNMSHELRTPLNGILGYAEALREDLVDTPSGEFAGIIHQSGTRLLTIVNAILELTALEDHRVPVNLHEENLRELVLQAVGRCSPQAQEKGLALECNVAAEVPLVVLCDGQKILRVLDNLLCNAVRFTDKGRIVVLVSRPSSEFLKISVQDTGIGIPEKQHQKIFEKFSQVDDSPNRANDGAGLGLTIAQRLATLMGGELTLESSESCGSTFSLSVPLTKAAILAGEEY